MTHQVFASKVEEIPSKALYRVSGAAALMASGLLVAAVISLIMTIVRPVSWLSLLENNWLVIIFKLHAGFSGVGSSLLYRLNVLDIFVLVLIATMYMGLYIALRGTSRLWSMIASIQPVLGILLFVITHAAGRCAVMGAELVIAFVMLRSGHFSKHIASMAILSAVLLLAGDLGGSLAPSIILAVFVGVGYLVLLSWLFLVGLKLFQFAQEK